MTSLLTAAISTSVTLASPMRVIAVRRRSWKSNPVRPASVIVAVHRSPNRHCLEGSPYWFRKTWSPSRGWLSKTFLGGVITKTLTA